MLTFYAAPIDMLLAVQDLVPCGILRSGVDQELPETEGLIVEVLAESVAACEDDMTQIEELLSASDPAIVAALLRRYVLWRRALSSISGTLPWPIETRDVWLHVVKRLPPKLPADFPPEDPPKTYDFRI
jgi:hypothetical protein